MTQQQHLDAADDLRSQHDKAIARIRSRTELNDTAKIGLMARAYLDAKAKMNELERTSTATTAATRASLERSAFGVGDLPGDPAANSASYRDAADRAARLATPDEAAAMLARAERSGDEPLARAVASHVYDQGHNGLGHMNPGWSEVLDAYLEPRPNKALKVQQINELRNPGTVRAMFSHVLPMPSELSKVPPALLQQYADNASSIG